jgi:hypothetical protein
MASILEVIEIGDGCQVVDRRGRLVRSFGNRERAEGFVEGYDEGRHDGGAVAAVSVSGLPARIAGGGR